eukprot:CAMPEP_0206192598 /NCGR_PEP_ID=MMETSP0166-20121206/6056_1 /ASSEMBLY_ACC=CAM_ASM_000260 /TAXON_ID=95228 /ORGANISM="Vannella robusta, Strain DIVA3 518/3/11/1/6" /LENGTH=821 /DNA_ID=CAMNT_0053609129 /DNA_START=92 /DNA_END=2558 /DNA_ORIENTATION=-
MADPFDSSVFRNSHFPEEHEKLPLPVVTDVNGDGKNDIVYVTTDFEVKIASSADIYEMGEEIADSSMVAFNRMKLFSSSKDNHLKLKLPDLTATYSASLLPQFAITYGRRPVALAVGYIDPPSNVQRKQVIVVLTDGWVVMCFDYELRLLWESHAVENPNPSFFHREASILIDHTPLTNGDRGIIIVGGRKELIATSEGIAHEHMDKEDFIPDPMELHKMKDEALDPPEPRKRIRKLQGIDDPEPTEEDDTKEPANDVYEEEALEELEELDIEEEDPAGTNEAGDEASREVERELEEADGNDDPPESKEDKKPDEAQRESNDDTEVDDKAPKRRITQDEIDAAIREVERELKEADGNGDPPEPKEEKKLDEAFQKLKESKQSQSKDDDEDNSHEEQNHFSYYAFEGHSGTLRWKHEPGDFEDLDSTEANLQQAVDIFSQPSAGAETPDMALKLHLFQNLRHLGERDWSFFSEDMQEQLPFVWRTREDTKLTSSHFERQRNFGNPTKVNDLQEEYRTFHKRNVLVSRNSRGLEVLHLYSGRPLTRLELMAESLYLDVNNDGVVDRVQAIPEKPRLAKKRRKKKEKDTCVAVAVSGVPPVDTLFETSVCSSSTFAGFNLGFDRLRKKDENVDMANPTFAYAGNRRYNTVFLVSSGKVTALSPEGEIVWQADTDATWGKVDGSKKKPGRSTRFGKVESFLEMGGFPSIQPFSLYGAPDMLVAVGYHTLSVLSSSTGSVEAESRLPTVANGPIVVGDWDSDGDFDIIVPCINGFVGMRITNGSGTPLYSIMFGLIILALPILYFANQPAKKKKSKPSYTSDDFIM